MKPTRRGVTLVEIVVASVLATLIVGGTMLAFLMSAMLAQRHTPNQAEGVFYAQQTIDRFRNRMACDDPWFAGSANCSFQTPLRDQRDDIKPDTSPLLRAPGGSRRYTVQPVDLDRDGFTDYYQMTVKVCWNDASC